MKKSLLLLFGLLSLNAQTTVSNTNTTVQNNSYEVAYSFYKNKNYEVAYEIFNALFKNNLENKEINFYLGRSAFELKKYDEAYSAFERILIKYPNENRAKLELARIDYIQGRYKSSKKAFLELKQQNLPKNVQNNIDIYLSKIAKKTQKSFINGIYMVGVGYDSNINNRATSDTFYIPSNSLTFTNTTNDESSSNIYSALVLNHKYQYKDDITIKNDFLVYAKAVLKDSSKNIGYLSYSPSVDISYDKVSIQYGAFVDFLRYDNKYYMNTYGINPSLSYLYSSKTKIDLSFKYQNKVNKIDENKNKDSINKSLSLNLTNILNTKYTLQTKLKFEDESKKDGDLSNIDYRSTLLALALQYKKSKRFMLGVGVSYNDKKYKDISNIYLKKQENDEYIYNLNSLYVLKNKWINKIDISHTDVKSNFDSNEYKKNTISISFMKRF
jgi:hypothetical protein